MKQRKDDYEMLYHIRKKMYNGQWALKALLDADSIVEPMNLIKETFHADVEMMSMAYLDETKEKVICYYERDRNGQIRKL